MDFLKAILGDELYAQVEQAINAHNGNEANKDNQIKLANLASGEYVGKGKHAALEAENQTNASKLAEANNLIQQLQKAAKGNEEAQGQITAYQTKVQELEAELEETKVEAAMDRALTKAGANVDDFDYLKFQWRKKGEVKLDDKGEIKGGDDAVSELKTHCPAQFASASGGDGGYQVYDPKKLSGGTGGERTPSKDEFRAMTYEQRVALKEQNEQLYKQLAK